MFKKGLAYVALVCLMAGTWALSSAKAADLAKGKAVFTSKCILCHGATGAGNGPASMTLNPKPANFASKSFWQTPDIERTMANIIKSGKGQMTAFPDLPADDIEAVIQYIKQTFKPK